MLAFSAQVVGQVLDGKCVVAATGGAAYLDGLPDLLLQLRHAHERLGGLMYERGGSESVISASLFASRIHKPSIPLSKLS
jgi:hypothetical protein